MANDDDKTSELVRRAMSLPGDNAAFERIVVIFSPQLISHVRSKAPWADAEAIVQEVWIRALLSRGKFEYRDVATFKGWLYATTKHLVQDSARRRARFEAFVVEQVPVDGGIAFPDLESLMLQLDVARPLAMCIDSLPENYRQAIILYFFEGKDREQAADELGVSVDALRGHLQRGKSQLRDCLTQKGIDHGTFS